MNEESQVYEIFKTCHPYILELVRMENKLVSLLEHKFPNTEGEIMHLKQQIRKVRKVIIQRMIYKNG